MMSSLKSAAAGSLYLFLIIPVLLFPGGTLAGKEKYISGEKKDSFVIWALSDIQPRDRKERVQFETAVGDLTGLFPLPDAAIVAGDIMQRKRDAEADFTWFLKTRKKTGIVNWFEIAGNHDARGLLEYFRFIKKPYFYSVEIGNIRMIFLSDEVNNSPTVISDEAFRWWEKEVRENQDKCIITVTHAALPESGLAFTGFYRSKVLRSERFVKVLKKYRVDLWFSGHTTTPEINGFNEKAVPSLNNTLFLNLSAIRREMGISVKSRLLIFTQNSNILLIKMRDHNQGKFRKKFEIKLKLKQPFRMKNRKPRIIYPPGIVPES